MRRMSFRILLFAFAIALGYFSVYLTLYFTTPKVEDDGIEDILRNVKMCPRFPLRPPSVLKPNPFALVLSVKENRTVILNRQEFGTLSDLTKLKKILKEVFSERESTNEYKPGTKEVEKSVTILKNGEISREDFLNLVEALNEVGANPIQLADYENFNCCCGGGSG